MTIKARSWLDDSVTPDVAALSAQELMVVWQTNRNSRMGGIAADEILRRVMRSQLLLLSPEEVTNVETEGG